MTFLRERTAWLWDRLRSNGIWLTALLAVGVFLGIGLFVDLPETAAALSQFGVVRFGGLLALVTVAYAVRFLKWQFYLRHLDVDVSTKLSAVAFGSGLMMVLTPGKAGELWKAWFLRDRADVPIGTTSSVVAAERITDLVALASFALLGVAFFDRGRTTVFLVGAVLLGTIAVLQWSRLCHAVIDALSTIPVVGRYSDEIREMYDDSYALFQVWPLTVSVLLSLIAWGIEGVTLLLAVSALGESGTVLESLFVFGLSSVVGAVSMLPGGLAAAEASMIGLLLEFGYSRTTAGTATVIVRVATLWYASVLGTTVFLVHKYRR